MTAMPSTRLVAHFEGLGMTAADAEAKAALFHEAEEKGREFIGGSPQWRWFVPGRIEIFGKHTDYAGGRSLLAAVPRGMAVIARARSGRRRARRRHPRRPADRSRSVASGAARLSRTAPLRPRGGAAVVPELSRLRARRRHRDCQRSAARVGPEQLERAGVRRGLGAGRGARRLASGTTGRRTFRRCTALAWYLGCVENGLDFQGLPGASGVGTHGGSEDHTAIIACRLHHVSQYQFVPVTPLGDVPMPARLDVRDCLERRAGRQGRLGDGALQPRRQWRARAARDRGTRVPSIPARSLAAALGSAPGAVARLRNWIADSADDPVHEPRISARACSTSSTRLPARRSAAQAFASSRHRRHRPARARVAARGGRAAGQPDSGDDRAGRGWRARPARLAPSSFGAGFGGSVWAARPRRRRRALRATSGSAPTQRRCRPSARCRGSSARPGPPLTELPTE